MNLLESQVKKLIERMIGSSISSLKSNTETFDPRPISEFPGSRPSFVRKLTISHEMTITFTTLGAIKTAAPNATKELLRQIESLLNIDPAWSKHFPTILAAYIDVDPPYYIMRYWPYPSFRDLVLNAQITTATAVASLQRVFDFLFATIYEKNVQPAKEDFCTETHLGRIRRRLKFLSDISPYFHNLIEADSVEIGNRTFSNILPLIERIERNERLLRALQPPRLNEIHGDLELAHILVDVNGNAGYDFVLLDPRFPGASDVAYDLGKLWQSVEGLLDLIAAGKFQLEMTGGSATPEFGRFEVSDPLSMPLLSDIAKAMPKFLERYDLIRMDPHWRERTEFSAIAHICSASPFYLKYDGREEVALALYLRGLQLLNHFVERQVLA